MQERNPELRLLNCYSGSGIGDFGIDLARAFQKEGYQVALRMTNPGTESFLKSILFFLRGPGPAIANVGLTAWGPSPWRNFLGFVAIGAKGLVSRNCVVILHNLVEVTGVEEAGYHDSGLTRYGARLAIRLLARCKIVVVSQRIKEILEKHYGFNQVFYTPLPCHMPEVRSQTFDEPVQFCTIGYIAPYKGIDLIIDASKLLDSPVKIVVIGSPHLVLSSTPSFQAWFDQLKSGASGTSVHFTGRLDWEQVNLEFSKSVAGLLTYKSPSGASASFASLASAGLPIIATNLDEFKELEALGAGILLVGPNAREVASAMERIASDESLRQSLREKQTSFARRFSWSEFVKTVSMRFVG